MLAGSIVGLLAALASGPARAEAPQACPVEVLAPVEGARREALLASLQAGLDEASLPELLELVGPEAYSRAHLYLADIDNDGAEDHVLATIGGTMHVLSLAIYSRSGTHFRRVPEPFGEDDLPIHYSAETLSRSCGQTYITTAGGRGGADLFPASQIWKDGKLRVACDRSLLQHRRQRFQALFDERKYDNAHGFLDGVQAQCRSAADAELWLWMQSDLALTAARMHAEQDCLKHVEAAERHPAFATAGATLQKAVATNAAACRRSLELEGQPGHDFGWLIAELRQRPDLQVVLDRRFDQVLAAIVPEAELEDGQLLRDAIRLSLWVPDETEFLANRYVVVSGCEAHNCTNRGFLWIDPQTRQGVAVNGGIVACRGLEAAQLPPEFWNYTRDRIHTESGAVTFYGRDGRALQVPIPR